MVLLTPEQHKQLSEPSLESLKDFALKQNYDLISHTELVELTTKANNPSIEKLKEVAKVNQFVLIPTDEHIEMKKQAEATIQDKLEELIGS